jgi:hypothetical protein
MLRNFFYKLILPNYTTTPDIIINNNYGYLKINNQKVKFPKGVYVFIKLVPSMGVVSKINGIETREVYYTLIDNDFYVEANGECEIIWQKVS